MGTVPLSSIATQALLNVQAAINTVSTNVSNVQNPNYNQRQAVFQSPNNVQNLVSVQRITDFSLQAQVLDANSAVGASDESQRLYAQMASLANIDSNGTGVLQGKLQAFSAAWSAYQSSPQDPAVQTALVQAGNDFASEVRNQFTQLKVLQTQEQGNISIDVNALNAALNQLATVNVTARAENASSTGVSAGTADQQDAAVSAISQFVALNVFRRPDGSVAVYTKNGIALVDKIVNPLAYDPINNNIYQSGGAAPVSFNASGSFNGGFLSGKLGAEIQALDPTNPATNGTPAATAIFEKYREQLGAVVDLFASKNGQGFLDQTSRTMSTVSGSSTITLSAAAPATWQAGYRISGPGIPPNTTITAINGTSVTLSNAASSTNGAGTAVGVANQFIDLNRTGTTVAGSNIIANLPTTLLAQGWLPGENITDFPGVAANINGGGAGTKILSVLANGFTDAQTGTTAASNTITNVSSVSGWHVGYAITGTNIPANTVITAINTVAGPPVSYSVTISNAATGSTVGGSLTVTSGLALVLSNASTTTNTAAQVAVNSQDTPFNQAFNAAPSDRSTDVTSGSSATDPLPQGSGFFITQHSPGQLDEASFAVNASLLSGTATVNRQAVAPVVNFFTSSVQSLGSPTAIGGLTVASATPEGLIAGVTANLAQNQSDIKTQDTNNTSTKQALQNSYSAHTGVNSDTELAKLQTLQNQYAATARLLNTVDVLFQSLLNVQ